MTSVQAIAVVIIRLWAILAIIINLFWVAQSGSEVIDGEKFYVKSGYAHLMLGSAVLTLAFWTFILLYSGKLTSRILPPRKDEDGRVLIEADDAVRSGVFLIGVFYLTEYVPDLLRSAPGLFAPHMPAPDIWDRIQDADFILALLASLVSVLVALWLIFRPGDLVRLFARLSEAARRKAAAGPADVERSPE